MVPVAHAEVAGAGAELAILGLGSCVAVVLHDPVARVGGMAHVLLPAPQPGVVVSLPAKFASTAVPFLLREMERQGAARKRLVACLVGGASMFGTLLTRGVGTGERNVEAVRLALRKLGIPVRGEAVGEKHGRSVSFSPADGRVVVSSYRHGETVL